MTYLRKTAMEIIVNYTIPNLISLDTKIEVIDDLINGKSFKGTYKNYLWFCKNRNKKEYIEELIWNI